jgi:dTDP-4-amino-4,6-dideoxygalactose transaminase
MVGWNARMDGIQGAVLGVKLRHLGRWNEARRRNARAYADALSGVAHVELPVEARGRRHVYHLFAVRVPARDRVLEALKARDVHCGIHYPVPVHRQEAYRHLGLGAGAFPVAEGCAEEVLSLPMFPELRPEQIAFVVRELGRALGEPSDGREGPVARAA